MSTISDNNTELGLFYRMTHRSENNIENENMGEVSSFTVTFGNNISQVNGFELMAALSELSLSIIHDEKYNNDYVEIYRLLRSINDKNK